MALCGAKRIFMPQWMTVRVLILVHGARGNFSAWRECGCDLQPIDASWRVVRCVMEADTHTSWAVGSEVCKNFSSCSLRFGFI
jgi:pimeloyl-ACP methyl ester carboxylesterase